MSINRGKRPLPVHEYLIPEARLVLVQLYDFMWNARVWRIPGKRKSVLIDWGHGLSDEQWLSDEWQRLITLGRRLVLAEMDGACDHALSAKTIETTRGPLLYFLRWMYANNYYDLSEIDARQCGYYRDDVKVEFFDEDDPDDSLSQARLSTYLDVPVRFFRHRQVFKDFPEMIPEEHPYGGEKALKVAEEIVIKATKHIPRVPVSVQNAVLSKTSEFLWERSPDILLLQRLFVAAREAGSHYVGNSYMHYTDKVLREFRFNRGGDLTEAWRPALEPKLHIRRNELGNWVEKSYGLTSQFKFLQADLRDASVITLLGLGGMRISDLAAFQAEPRQADGWPYCLVRRPSPSGLFDLFYARGPAVKGSGDVEREEGEVNDEEWLIGSHPVGSNSLPDAVKAMLVLDELFEPWREQAGSTSLVVSLGRGMGPPRNKLRQPEVMMDTFRRGQIAFIANHVELPAEFSDWLTSPHQWRKSYAEDIVTINPELLPSLQQQFKQLNRAVLEASYVGNAPYFNRMIADQRAISTADAMYAIIQGGTIAMGENEDNVRKISENLGKLVEAFPTEKKKKNILLRMIEEEGISLWGQTYGDCMFRGATSRCHFVEKGRFDPSARKPMVVHVCAELCSQCSNLLIGQHQRGFWKERAERFEQSLLSAEANGETAFAMVCRSHLAVARNIIRRLDKAKEELSRAIPSKDTA